MTWYTAILLFKTRIKDDLENNMMWEEVLVLVRANSDREAMVKADRVGRDMQGRMQNTHREAVMKYFVEVVDVEDLGEDRLHSGMPIYGWVYFNDD